MQQTADHGISFPLLKVHGRAVGLLLRHGYRGKILYAPFDVFLPIPSLSTTSSAHLILLSSTGSPLVEAFRLAQRLWI
jgi:hypothetical protein